MKIERRTFEALKYDKGTPERARLNLNSITSEYLTSYRYVICEDSGKTTPFTYRTRREAEVKLRQMQR